MAGSALVLGGAGAMGRENYTLEKLVLAQQGAVPDDASVVIVAGPKIDFFPNEIEALKKYLDKAGKLLLEIDPPDKADSPDATNLIALAHDWGMDVGRDVVVDASGMGRLIGTDASVPVVATYGSHPITENFSFVTAFPLAREAAGYQVYSNTPGVPPRAGILNTNGRDRWLSIIQIGEQKDDRPRPWTDAETIEIIRAHVGVPDLDVTLLNRSTWRMSKQVAANFRNRC